MRYIICLATAAALALPAAASALPSLSANPANRMLSRGLDPIRYDDATRCNGGHIPPGTKAMLGWLTRNARGVNWGEYRCEMWGKHSASIHSAGRAIDWHPATMSDGYALVRLLLAPDSAGNPAALARRMGVQGLIFNCHAWFGGSDGQMGDYSYCFDKKGRRKHNLDPTLAHMNHVHIELNLLGAAMKTTFWNPRISYPLQNQAPASPPQQQWPSQWPGTQGSQSVQSGGTQFEATNAP